MGRVTMVVAAGAVSGFLSVSGQAWACTPQARIVAASPAVGPPLSASSVRGEAVTPEAPVEIRWNGVKGPVVGTALADKQGAFTAAVAVPDVAPGVYTLVAVAGTAGLTRTAFEVTAATAPAVVSAAPSNVWSSGSGSGIEASDSGSSSGAVMGVGLLAFGLVGVVGGFAVVAGRRRRVPADSSSRH